MPPPPRGKELSSGTPAPAPPPFDAGRAAVFAVGIGAPVAICLALAGPAVALFAGVGALNSLITDPRRRVVVRLVAIVSAMAAVLVVARVAEALRPHPELAQALAVLLAFPAGLVPPAFPYLSMVAKLLPLTMIVVATGVFPSGHVLVGFVAGTAFATAATLVEGWLRPVAAYDFPLRELVALWRGQRNSVAYAVAFAAAVALALTAAYALTATHPMWAVVAAIFVMHPDYERSMRRIGKRIGGTLAGVAVAWLIVHYVHSPWVLVALATVSATFMPWAVARSLFAGTLAATVFLLVLFDVGLIAQGGDRSLVLARLWDTLIGSAAVVVALLLLKLWRRAYPSAQGGDATGDPVEPPASVDPGGHV